MTTKRLRPTAVVAGLIGLALIQDAAAQAPGWNLYDINPATGQPFVAGPTIAFPDPMSSGRGAKVNLTVGNGPALNFTMDTGSNGILVTREIFSGEGARYLGPGTETLTSSGIVYHGNLYETDVAINSGGAKAATSRVVVLQVTSTTCTEHARGCTPNPNPTGITYMGIGFNRSVSTVTPTPDNPLTGIRTNVFTSIVALGPDNQPATNLQPGYIISDSGVTLGLSAAATSNFAFVKLTPDSSPSPSTQAGTVWQPAPATLSVGGHVGTGTILPDSGIDYAFLTPPKFVGVAPCATDPPGGSTCLPPGVEVLVFLPGQTNPIPAIYSLTETGSPLSPAAVQLNPPDSTTFLNTGRLFYQGFNYLFDPTNGLVGYLSVNEHAIVVPSVALTGSVALPNAFANGLPTVLFGDTRLLQAGSGTISGAISGPGSLTIGSGRMTLTGLNTYTGGTAVTGGATLAVPRDESLGAPTGGLAFNGGTLQALASFSSARPVSLEAGGGAVDTFGSTVTLSGAISGPGGLTKQGAGQLTLLGSNSYAGGTTVSGGVLVGSTTSLQGNIVDNGVVVFDQGSTGTYAGVISGTGAVGVTGGGNVTLSGANSYSGGTQVGVATTLQGTTTSLQGNIVNNGAVVFNQGSGGTYAGSISGTGGVTLTGGGAVNLTGAHTYSGATSVSNGVLSVNGSIAGSVSVGAAGTLGGSGAIGGNVAMGGTLAPGNSIGTLTIGGSYTHAAAGTFQVEANAAGQADRVTVGGAATLQGGTVSVIALPGTYSGRITTPILSAAGGLSGSFAQVVDSLPFLQTSLSYDANTVYLSLQPGGFSLAAQNPTQAAVAAVLDANAATATGDLAAVLTALSTATTAQGQAALTALSGNNYAGFSTSMVQGLQLFLDNFASQAGGGSPTGNRVALAEACDVACDGAAPAKWGAWGGALGGLGTIGAGQRIGAVTYNAGGFAAGLDRAVSDSVRVGVTAGYSTGTQWVGGFNGLGRTDTWQAGLYAGFAQDKVYADGVIGYAWSANQMWRTIAIPGLQPRTAQGQTGANQWYGQVEAGYRFDVGGDSFVTPFARLQAYTGTQNAFTETGAQSLDLTVARQTTNSLRSVIGAQLGTALDLGWRDKLALQLRLGWSHEYADVGRPVTAALAGAPMMPFTTWGVSPQRDGFVLGLAANTAIAEGTSLYLRYEGNMSGQDNAHALTAGLRMTW